MATSPAAVLPKMQRLLATSVYDGVTLATSGAAPATNPESYNDLTNPWQRLLHYNSFSHGISQENLDTSEQIGFGSYELPNTAVVQQRAVCRPSGVFEPRVGDWKYFLPWIMNCPASAVGAIVSGATTYAPGLNSAATYGNLATKRNLMFDDSRRVFNLKDVAVTRATFSSSQAPGANTALKVALEMLGKTYVIDATYPEGDAAAAAQDLGPSFIHPLLTVSFSGYSPPVQCRSFSLTHEYGMDPDRFFNSLTLQEQVIITKRTTITLNMPLGVHAALWDLAQNAPGVAVLATYTYGTKSIKFDLPNAISAAPPVLHGVPSETYFDWTATAHAAVTANVITQTGFRIHMDSI